MAVIGSARATNEDNFVVQKFAREVLGTRHLDFQRHVVDGDEDAILIRADKSPNSLGALAVGVRPSENGFSFAGVMRAIREGDVKALYVVDDNIAGDPAVAAVLPRLEFLVVNASVENETTRLADVVLASSTFAEKNGTFVHFQGRVQRIRPSVATLEQDRAMDGFAMSRLDKFGSVFDRWAKGSKRDARPTWRILTGIAALMGVKFKYATAEDVFSDIAQSVEGFKGMTYLKIGSRGLMLKTKEEVRTPIRA